MRGYAISKKKEELLISKQKKWIRGLSTLVSNTQIREDELAEAVDIQLVEDGKIQFPRDGQDYFGNSSGERVTGLFPYYKSNGTRELLRIAESNLQKFNESTENWDNISGKTYSVTTPSPSLSPSASTSPSHSLSPSSSASPSPSSSPSPSNSPSLSPSASTSPSASASPSGSLSPSASTSPSLSPSGSLSPSKSASNSPSASLSPSSSPSASTSPSHTDSLNTNGVTAFDRLYLANGTDNLTYYDGTSITTFTELTMPTNLLVTRTGGSTGTFTFSYRVSAVSAIGETEACMAASTTASFAHDALDTSNYMTVTWTAVDNAIGYNVYGRTDGHWRLLKYIEGQATATYADKGTEEESEVFSIPEANFTAGPTGAYISLYKDSLFIAGDAISPSRLYYSGGGDRINDFSVANGGGFIDVNKNDGQRITGMIVFKNSLLVFKEDSIYQFEFTTTGLPQITQVNPAVGCIAPRSLVAVENDIFFASRRGVFTVGNEPGFAFDVLRTNELSARVRSVFQSIESEYLENIAAIYATKANTNLVIFSYTPSGGAKNTNALVYDRERLAWYKWSNIKANCWVSYVNSTGETRILYGDDTSGYVKEILTGTDDFGSAIQATATLKAVDFDLGLDRYKKLKDVSVVLREPTGSVIMNIIKDGVSTETTMNISTTSPAINFKHYLFSKFTFMDSYGTGAITSSDDIVLRTKKNLNYEGKAFQLSFTNGSSGANFTLLQASMIAKARSLRYRSSGDLIS